MYHTSYIWLETKTGKNATAMQEKTCVYPVLYLTEWHTVPPIICTDRVTAGGCGLAWGGAVLYVVLFAEF